MDSKIYSVLYPNVVPPEILNCLLLLIVGFLTYWIYSFVSRCYTLFEGVYAYKRKHTYLINVEGVDELCNFWSDDPVREFLLSFLREKLESPKVKIKNVKGTLSFKKNTLRIENKRMFGRDHSHGVTFHFDAEVPCSVELFWQVKEKALNEKVLDQFKLIASGKDEEERRIFDLKGILKHEEDFLAASEGVKFKEPGKDMTFVCPPKIQVPTVFREAYFRPIPVKKTVKKKKSSRQGSGRRGRRAESYRVEEESEEEVVSEKESIIPLVIYIKNDKLISDDTFDDEICAILLCINFPLTIKEETKEYKIEVKKELYLGTKGIYEVSEVFEEEDREDCVICYAVVKQVTLIPCCHFCVCKKCLKKIEQCPICRFSIDGFLFKE